MQYTHWAILDYCSRTAAAGRDVPTRSAASAAPRPGDGDRACAVMLSPWRSTQLWRQARKKLLELEFSGWSHLIKQLIVYSPEQKTKTGLVVKGNHCNAANPETRFDDFTGSQWLNY